MYVCILVYTHFFSLAEYINSICDVMKEEYAMCCFP